MTQYIIPSDGFQSFNEFFARHINMNYRPIAEPMNDLFITSPCDGNVSNVVLNNLTNETVLTVKGNQYALCKILNYNQNYCKRFIGGTAIQIYLDKFNYHRYHTAVSGTVIEKDFISGYMFLWSGDGRRLEEWFASENQRGIMYVENDKLGLVAHVFVGIDIVASVNIDVDEGLDIDKGDEVGCFKYGGSSILLLFEPGIISEVNVNIFDIVKVGQKIAISTGLRHEQSNNGMMPVLIIGIMFSFIGIFFVVNRVMDRWQYTKIPDFTDGKFIETDSN